MLGLAALVIWGLTGCGGWTLTERGGEGKPCFTNGECDEGLTCLEGVCVSVGEDGDLDPDETPVDGDDEEFDSALDGDEFEGDSPEEDGDGEADDDPADGDPPENDADPTDGDQTDGDGFACEAGICTDPATGFEWQQDPSDVAMLWDDAVDYCQRLNLGGEGWRLPNLSELRTLVRDCAPIETGGTCGIVDACTPCGVDSGDACLSSSCRSASACNPAACPDQEAPNGCYWPALLNGNCAYTWSSSSLEDDDAYAWAVDFGNAEVDNGGKDNGLNLRCMRDNTIPPDGDEESEFDISDGDPEPESELEESEPTFLCADGICTDTITGLKWQETPTGGEMIWSDAITHCQNLDVNGKGWRLPNISERNKGPFHEPKAHQGWSRSPDLLRNV